MPHYSRLKPDLELTKTLWVVSEVNQPGSWHGHLIIVFEGLNEAGDPWLWAAEFMPMDHEVLDAAAARAAERAGGGAAGAAAAVHAEFNALVTRLRGTPGLVRTTDPHPDNAGGEKGRMPGWKVDDAHLAEYSAVSHRVPKADAIAAQRLVNTHELEPPVYGGTGDAGWVAGLFSTGTNCASWVTSILRAARLDDATIHSGMSELLAHKPKARDGAGRPGAGSDAAAPGSST